MKQNDNQIISFEKSIIHEILGPYMTDLKGTHEELISSFSNTLEKFHQVPNDLLDYKYQNDKWSIKELLIHIIDSTQILGLRLLAISRGGNVVLPVFDENAWAENIEYSKIGLEYLSEGYLNQIKVIQWQLLNHKANADNFIICNNTKIFYNEMIKYIIGHERFHLNSLFGKYLSNLN